MVLRILTEWPNITLVRNEKQGQLTFILSNMGYKHGAKEMFHIKDVATNKMSVSNIFFIFRECLLLFSPKSFVFPFHTKNTKD
jgi:hypothetical protein